jgi:cobalt-zinc-cadmium efflux system protein
MGHHHHGHGHSHAGLGGGDEASHAANQRRLTIVFGLAAAYTGVELAGGLWTGSLALLADAFHLLSDVAALGLALFAAWMSRRPADARRTFGHSRAEILAALANGAGLAGIAIVICVHAFERFGQPAEVHGLGVVVFASGALVYELVSLRLLSGGGDNLNVRGAWLHVASDALGSLGAIASGLAIWAFGWYWADPAASLLISVLILHSAWRLIAEAVDVLMETAPEHLDVAEIHGALLDLPGVTSVHDLHVWTIGSGEVSLSSHVVTAPGQEPGGTLERVRALLRERFEIQHTTVQIEAAGEGGDQGDIDCDGACEPRVAGATR